MAEFLTHYYKIDMILAFIPVRLKSSRFPNKAIQSIYNISAIERCLINASNIKGVDKVIIATSTNPEDDILESFSLNNKVEVFRGPEDDVLERIMPAISKYEPNHIIRITGDCPLISFELAEIMIQNHLEYEADGTFTLSKVALGTAGEIYKTEAICKLKTLQPITNHSEYLVYYFLNNPQHFKLKIFDAPEIFIKPWRLTIDEKNDLELLNMIFSYLDVGYRPVKFDEIIEYFHAFPEHASINMKNVVKYRDNKDLAEYLRKVTSL